MDELTFFKKQVADLDDINLELKREVAYLRGKVEAYELFLEMKGYIKTELKREDEDDDNLLLCNKELLK
jgi:hypothetical protein